MSSVSSCCRQFIPYLGKAAVAAGAAAAVYAGGLPSALTAIAVCGYFKYVAQKTIRKERVEVIPLSSAFDDVKEPSRVDKVQDGLKKELYKRLPQPLKDEIVAATQAGPVSHDELELLKDPKRWPNIEIIHKIAIRASLEGAISEEELSYLMLHCMAIEMKENLPGIKFMPTRGVAAEKLDSYVNALCKKLNISKEQFFKIVGKDDFFILDMNEPLNPSLRNHYTAILSGQQYRFTIGENKRRMFVFPPYVFERFLQHFYGPAYEKPLFVLGTRSVEKLSDNTQRIVSMTGGKTIPTPNIEANESLAFPFYVHDCYHVEIDSAIGEDRVFWNAFGKRLLAESKTADTLDMGEALRTLGEFCLDKEFQNYQNFPKNAAFIIPLLGMFSIAGKRATDDQEDPFKPIGNAGFTQSAQRNFLRLFTRFWQEEVPHLALRKDLTKEEILAVVPGMKKHLSKQGDSFPKALEMCLYSLTERG